MGTLDRGNQGRLARDHVRLLPAILTRTVISLTQLQHCHLASFLSLGFPKNLLHGLQTEPYFMFQTCVLCFLFHSSWFHAEYETSQKITTYHCFLNVLYLALIATKTCPMYPQKCLLNSFFVVHTNFYSPSDCNVLSSGFSASRFFLFQLLFHTVVELYVHNRDIISFLYLKVFNGPYHPV